MSDLGLTADQADDVDGAAWPSSRRFGRALIRLRPRNRHDDSPVAVATPVPPALLPATVEELQTVLEAERREHAAIESALQSMLAQAEAEHEHALRELRASFEHE